MTSSSIFDDDDGAATTCSDSGIRFEQTCGTENMRVLKAGEVTSIAFGDRGVKDAGCINKFHEQIRELIDENNCRVLILDLQGVWFLPSQSLGALMSLRKKVDRVELHNVSDELHEGLRIAQLEELLHVTYADAVK